MMSWNRIILDNYVAGSDLARQIDALFAQQRENWPLLRDGLAALEQAKSKVLAHDGRQIVLQANRAGIRGALAEVAAPVFSALKPSPPRRGASHSASW